MTKHEVRWAITYRDSEDPRMLKDSGYPSVWPYWMVMFRDSPRHKTVCIRRCDTKAEAMAEAARLNNAL